MTKLANSKFSNVKLSDTQLVIMSAAAQREDRCLVASANLKGGAARKVAEKLIATGLVKEIRAKPGMAAWRRDEEAGQSYALRLTAAGLKAIPVVAAALPRAGSKLAEIVGLLCREGGASIDELIATTDWQAHTVRAALTGLRKRGLNIERRREDGATRYRIIDRNP